MTKKKSCETSTPGQRPRSPWPSSSCFTRSQWLDRRPRLFTPQSANLSNPPLIPVSDLLSICLFLYLLFWLFLYLRLSVSMSAPLPVRLRVHCQSATFFCCSLRALHRIRTKYLSETSIFLLAFLNFHCNKDLKTFWRQIIKNKWSPVFKTEIVFINRTNLFYKV